MLSFVDFLIFFRIIFNARESLLYTEHGLVEDNLNYLSSAFHYFRFPFMHAADQFDAPQWVKDTVWYIILPDRFANGDSVNNPHVTQNWIASEHLIIAIFMVVIFKLSLINWIT